MNQLRIGVIGCGRMASELARRCVATGRAVITGISDPDPAAISAGVEEFGARAFDSHAALCRSDIVDAVLVGSPPGAHLDNVLIAADSGKHVYCEKPLATSVADCTRMITACADAGVRLFVGQVLRLFPLFWESRQILDAGILGAPRSISVTRSGMGGETFSQGWRATRALSGGMLMEINAHEIDYMRFIMGDAVEVYARFESIMGQWDYEDQGFVMISFASGAMGMLHTSLSSPVGEYRVHIQAQKGNILHGGFGGALQWRTEDGESGEVRPDDVGVPNPYDRELLSWIGSLLDGSEPLFTGADGRAAVAIAEAAYRSADLGRPVRISEL